MRECAVSEPPIYRVGGSDVRCLLYRNAEVGTGSLAGLALRQSGDGTGLVGDGRQTVSPATSLRETRDVSPSLPQPVGDAASDAPLLEVTGLTRHFGLRGFWSRK